MKALQKLKKLYPNIQGEVTPALFKEFGHDRLWRLNNLYWILDEAGKRVQFRLRWAQLHLFMHAWFCNIILKARQLGFTTAIDILALDYCLFTSDFEAAIIAHRKEDAEKIFRRKIKYPYDQLPEWFREKRALTTESKSQLAWNNNSVIFVSTSIRSGTVQFLHVSEHGKICRQYPAKAEELKTGSLNAIHQGQLVFIESTAEGRTGDFFDMCEKYRNYAIEERPLTKLDFKFHFFAWWQHPEYKLSDEDSVNVVITQEWQQYFNELEGKIDRKLSINRRAWYVKKAETMGDKMKQEFPGTPEEAFEASIEGAYYASEFLLIRKEKRITRIPIEPGVPVQVAWDLGMSDYMCLWFFQQIGREIRWIDYYENNGEGLPFYFKIMQDKGYLYGDQHLPHDASVRELRDGKSREEKFIKGGYKTVIAPKIDPADGIEEVRRILRMSWFDEERCAVGLARLEGYRKAWDEKQGCYKDRAEHDICSHGADAFRTGAVNIQFKPQNKPQKRRNRTGMAV